MKSLVILFFVIVTVLITIVIINGFVLLPSSSSHTTTHTHVSLTLSPLIIERERGRGRVAVELHRHSSSRLQQIANNNNNESENEESSVDELLQSTNTATTTTTMPSSISSTASEAAKAEAAKASVEAIKENYLKLAREAYVKYYSKTTNTGGDDVKKQPQQLSSIEYLQLAKDAWNANNHVDDDYQINVDDDIIIRSGDSGATNSNDGIINDPDNDDRNADVAMIDDDRGDDDDSVVLLAREEDEAPLQEDEPYEEEPFYAEFTPPPFQQKLDNIATTDISSSGSGSSILSTTDESSPEAATTISNPIIDMLRRASTSVDWEKKINNHPIANLLFGRRRSDNSNDDEADINSIEEEVDNMENLPYGLRLQLQQRQQQQREQQSAEGEKEAKMVISTNTVNGKEEKRPIEPLPRSSSANMVSNKGSSSTSSMDDGGELPTMILKSTSGDNNDSSKTLVRVDNGRGYTLMKNKDDKKVSSVKDIDRALNDEIKDALHAANEEITIQQQHIHTQQQLLQMVDGITPEEAEEIRSARLSNINTVPDPTILSNNMTKSTASPTIIIQDGVTAEDAEGKAATEETKSTKKLKKKSSVVETGQPSPPMTTQLISEGMTSEEAEVIRNARISSNSEVSTTTSLSKDTSSSDYSDAIIKDGSSAEDAEIIRRTRLKNADEVARKLKGLEVKVTNGIDSEKTSEATSQLQLPIDGADDAARTLKGEELKKENNESIFGGDNSVFTGKSTLKGTTSEKKITIQPPIKSKETPVSSSKGVLPKVPQMAFRSKTFTLPTKKVGQETLFGGLKKGVILPPPQAPSVPKLKGAGFGSINDVLNENTLVGGTETGSVDPDSSDMPEPESEILMEPVAETLKGQSAPFTTSMSSFSSKPQLKRTNTKFGIQEEEVGDDLDMTISASSRRRNIPSAAGEEYEMSVATPGRPSSSWQSVVDQYTTFPMLHIGNRIRSDKYGTSHEAFLALSSNEEVIPCIAKRPWSMAELNSTVPERVLAFEEQTRNQQYDDLIEEDSALPLPWELDAKAASLRRYYEVSIHVAQKFENKKKMQQKLRQQRQQDEKEVGVGTFGDTSMNEGLVNDDISAVQMLIQVCPDDGSGGPNADDVISDYGTTGLDVFGKMLRGDGHEWLSFEGIAEHDITLQDALQQVGGEEHSGHHLSTVQRLLNLPDDYMLGNVLDVVFRSLLEDLVFLSSCNIVHRDLQLKNLLCDGNNQRVMITNFGNAVDLDPPRVGLDNDSLELEIPGSIANSFAADSFSVAIIICQLLCNSPSHQQVQQQLKNGGYDLDVYLEQKLKSKESFPEEALDYLTQRPGLWALLKGLIRPNPLRKKITADSLKQLNDVLNNKSTSNSKLSRSSIEGERYLQSVINPDKVSLTNTKALSPDTIAGEEEEDDDGGAFDITRGVPFTLQPRTKSSVSSLSELSKKVLPKTDNNDDTIASPQSATRGYYDITRLQLSPTRKSLLTDMLIQNRDVSKVNQQRQRQKRIGQSSDVSRAPTKPQTLTSTNGNGSTTAIEVIAIIAPPGKLGVVVDDDGCVSRISEDSPLFGQLLLGDMLISVDEYDVRQLVADDVARLLVSRSANGMRRIEVAREVLGEAGSSPKQHNIDESNSECYNEVESWLIAYLPSLQNHDTTNYCQHLMSDGFDSVEMLEELIEDDLHFMKKGHRRVLTRKLLFEASSSELEQAKKKVYTVDEISLESRREIENQIKKQKVDAATSNKKRTGSTIIIKPMQEGVTPDEAEQIRIRRLRNADAEARLKRDKNSE